MINNDLRTKNRILINKKNFKHLTIIYLFVRNYSKCQT